MRSSPDKFCDGRTDRQRRSDPYMSPLLSRGDTKMFKHSTICYQTILFSCLDHISNAHVNIVIHRVNKQVFNRHIKLYHAEISYRRLTSTLTSTQWHCQSKVVCTVCEDISFCFVRFCCMPVGGGLNASRTLCNFFSAHIVTCLLSSAAEYPSNIFRSHTNLYTNLFPWTWNITQLIEFFNAWIHFDIWHYTMHISMTTLIGIVSCIKNNKNHVHMAINCYCKSICWISEFHFKLELCPKDTDAPLTTYIWYIVKKSTKCHNSVKFGCSKNFFLYYHLHIKVVHP
jgi:hypothetical protein